MTGEIFDHSDVADPVGKGTLPAGHDLMNTAEFAVLQSYPEVLECGVVPLDVANTPDELSRFKSLRQPAPTSS